MIPGNSVTYEKDTDGERMGLTARQGSLLKLSAAVNMESRLSVGCAGAVLTYIEQRKSVSCLPSDMERQSSFKVSAIQMFSLDGMM